MLYRTTHIRWMSSHRLLIALGVVSLLLSSGSVATRADSHLFILSGQSNMTGTVREAFLQTVQKRFSNDNVTVVMRMKSGRGIRFWVADYQQPLGRDLSSKKLASNGMEYQPLIDAARSAARDTDHDTVGFIWMQGESDANNRLSEAYGASFLQLIQRLKKDLQRDDLYYVIGRINDYARDVPDNEHWRRVRETQVRLGSTKGNAWVDTDDLNDEEGSQLHGDIHFHREGARKLGQRFAEQAIVLIEKRDSIDNEESTCMLNGQFSMRIAR